MSCTHRRQFHLAQTHVEGRATPNFQPAVSGQGIGACRQKSIAGLHDPVVNFISRGYADDPAHSGPSKARLPNAWARQRAPEAVKTKWTMVCVIADSRARKPDDTFKIRRSFLAKSAHLVGLIT